MITTHAVRKAFAFTCDAIWLSVEA